VFVYLSPQRVGRSFARSRHFPKRFFSAGAFKVSHN
jgi:hypothetical protein